MTAYAYDKDGNRQSVTRGDGVTTLYRYDSLNRYDGLGSARALPSTIARDGCIQLEIE